MEFKSVAAKSDISSAAVVAHGALSDEHRKELYKLSTKLHSTKNALPDKRYGGAK